MSNHIAHAIAIIITLGLLLLSRSGRTTEHEDVRTLVPGFRQVIIDPGYPGGDCRAIGDMTDDGVPDIVVNEHRGMRRLQIWENVNHGASWREHLIDAGKEGHLGAPCRPRW
jgi:hypothetical protein